MRPHILLTNDDGVFAPGIQHLWNLLKEMAEITIVAPASDQSGVGMCITTRTPLRLEKVEWPQASSVWSISGTPADAVKLGLNKVVHQRPDIIISGINRGTNAGRNVLYSGTIGAAIEGVMHGIPSIAFSCWDSVDPDYLPTGGYIPRLVHYILENPMPTGTFLNVNFPSKKFGEIKGVKMVRQGKELWMEDPKERSHPIERNNYFWLGAKLMEFDDEHAESDIIWLKKGYVTVVPVHVGELTDHHHLQSQKNILEDLFNF
jgi:5'-nucleotidase